MASAGKSKRRLTTSTPIWFVQIYGETFAQGNFWVPLGEVDFGRRGRLVLKARFGFGLDHLPETGYEYAFRDVNEHEPQPESQCSLIQA